MPIGTETARTPEYNFLVLVNDGNHTNHDLSLLVTLRNDDAFGQWSTSEMDAVAQQVMDMLSSLPITVSMNPGDRNFSTYAEITPTEN